MRKKKVFLLSPVLSTLMLLLFLGCGGGSGGSDNTTDPPSQTDPSSLSLSINYIDTLADSTNCGTVDAYFNVLQSPSGDQVYDLTSVSVLIDGNPVEFELDLVENIVPDSVVFAMDYSKSMTGNAVYPTPPFPQIVLDMESAVSYFISNMPDGTGGEIIKFASLPEVIQELTASKDELINAVDNLPTRTDFGVETNIYDTLYMAIDDIASREGRKAVILLTDGKHELTLTDAVRTKDQVISHAITNEVSIYSIGLGSENKTEIKDIAIQTNGLFFDASTGTKDIKAIYDELLTILSKQHRVRLINLENIIDVEIPHELTISATANGLPPAENYREFKLFCQPQ